MSQTSSTLRNVFAGRGPLALAIGAIGGGLLLLCLFALLVLQPEEDSAGLTPTPGPLIPTVPPGEALVVGVSDAGTISVTLDAPALLTVGGRDFAVQSQAIGGSGVWTPAVNSPTTALWVYGTVINYVFGLADTADNRALLEGLAAGAEMAITLQDGVLYKFLFSSREITAANNQDVFAQTTPGLTILLLGTAGGDRLVVRGSYVAAETPANSTSGNVVNLGETAQLDTLQITATSGNFLFDRPEAPPGFAFYLVDYQAQNVGSVPFDTSLLRLTLADDLGTQYALNTLAGQVGNFPALSGILNAGQTTQATAGYLVPAGLTSPNLRWLVGRSDTATQIEVTIPFGGGGEVAQAAVTLQQAEVSVDGTTLLLLGQVTNLGQQPLVVQENEMSLESQGTFHLIVATNPGFPWLVGPGQTIPFSLTFQRPAGEAAVFTLLNQPFQLSGLR